MLFELVTVWRPEDVAFGRFVGACCAARTCDTLLTLVLQYGCVVVAGLYAPRVMHTPTRAAAQVVL